MIKKVRAFIKTHQLIRPGDALLVGVSGGADSVALLAVLRALRSELGLRALGAVHVNHQLRRGAEADQRFVERLCEGWNIPCLALRVRVGRGASVEEKARDLRYEVFSRAAARVGADAVVLGHHRDDLAETVLMHLIRGTGLLGLQGIRPRRRLHGCSLIRPLLDVGRDEIERFLTAQKLSWREDPSNRQTAFLRNRIRQDLLPLLARDYNPNVRDLLAGLAETTACDYDFLQQEAEAAFQRAVVVSTRPGVVLAVPKLLRLHPSVRRMVLRLAVQQVKGDLNRLTFAHMRELEDLLAAAGPGVPEVSLPGGLCVTRRGQEVHARVRKA